MGNEPRVEDTMTNRCARRRCSLTLIVPVLAACGPSPTAPVDAPAPASEQPATPTYAYSVEVETRYIDIIGSCDTDIFGDEVPGEFQFHIKLSGPDGDRAPHQSRGYDEALGTMYQRNAGTNINFTNRTYVWTNLTSPNGVRIALNVSEWDGVRRDSRMSDRGNSERVDYALGTRTRTLNVGATSACRGRLYYDVTWTRVETAG